MKKVFAVLLLSVFLCVPAFAGNPDKDIVIIYTNDVHCGVDDHIGYAGLAFYRHEAEKRTPYVTLIDAGDAVQGAVIGTISNGRYIIEIMNAMDYDMAVPGNHEFDYGMSQFENFAKNLKCGYVSCNFKDAVTGQLVFEPYRMMKYGNTKIAFVGVCTPDAVTTSTPSSFMDARGDYIYDFDGDKTGEKLCATIQKTVDNARDAGADFVILVGHLGENPPFKEWSSLNVAAHTRGIDAIIDGHSHEVTPCLMAKNLDGKEIPITQTGTKLEYIGQVTIDTSGKVSTELIDSVSGRDEKVDALIRELKARYEDTLKTKLGKTDFDLLAVDEKGEWLLRNAETNICDFMADAFLAAADGAAEIAFVNAGNIRANLKAGELTYNDALNVSPFGSTVCICDVKGQTILDELEMSVRLMPQRSGGLLHVAEGVTYTVDITIPSPVQIDDKNVLLSISGPRRVKDVTVGGKPLDPNKTYSVLASSYVLREKGDGHRFEGAKLTKPDFITDADALAHYIKSFPTIPDKYRTQQGRMKIVSGN